MEAESIIVQLQAKDSRQPTQSWKRKAMGSPLEPSEGASPANTFSLVL